jgi:hypothetical protein
MTVAANKTSLEMDTVERGFICNIIDKQDAHCTSIVSCCDCAKTLLTSSIPYLKLYALVVKLNGSDFEINPAKKQR